MKIDIDVKSPSLKLGREQGWVRQQARKLNTKLVLFSTDLSRKNITELARELRKNPTPSESKFWELVRKRRYKGLRFLRQKPFVHSQYGKKRYFYIADFYCAKHKLVIEIDGKVHDHRKGYDKQRTIVLENLGLKVVRFKNEELVNEERVFERIMEAISSG
ncbi:MAG: endonuclease domain-containing protein [Balneola sp.]